MTLTNKKFCVCVDSQNPEMKYGRQKIKWPAAPVMFTSVWLIMEALVLEHHQIEMLPH
jgi:hypothetical protein